MAGRQKGQGGGRVLLLSVGIVMIAMVLMGVKEGLAERVEGEQEGGTESLYQEETSTMTNNGLVESQVESLIEEEGGDPYKQQSFSSFSLTEQQPKDNNYSLSEIARPVFKVLHHIIDFLRRHLGDLFIRRFIITDDLLCVNAYFKVLLGDYAFMALAEVFLLLAANAIVHGRGLLSTVFWFNSVYVIGAIYLQFNGFCDNNKYRSFLQNQWRI
eukprot:Nk52_evm111s151 gene=Nk52_evmTU111s151